MKKKLLWAVVALLGITVAVLIAAWPRNLPVETTHGEPPEFSSFEEIVDRAELIVLADVKAVKQGPDYVSPIIGESTVYRAPTQRVTLEVVKVYKGDAAPGQTLTLYQEDVGVRRSNQFPWLVFRINENDPVYERGERYVLILWPVPMGEEIKLYQPEPWQEGMFSVIHPAGRMRLNADGTVTSVFDFFGTNGKTLAEIEEKVAATIASLPKYNLEQAREALLTYFSLLHDQRYDEAVYFYGGSYDLLRDWNPTVEPNDYATLLKNGCTINGLMCLEAQTIVQEETVSSSEFQFVVEFMNEDGSLFMLGQQSQFTYTVMKVYGRFLVQDLPVYVP